MPHETMTQQEAQVRVQIKRQLRKLSATFNNTDSTESLQAKLIESQKNSEATNQVSVTFHQFSPKDLRGKTVEAVKVVTTHSIESVEYGRKKTYTYESVSYLYQGFSYGEEFFI